MNIQEVHSYEEMSREAAYILEQHISQHPDATIGFATGSTPIGLYQELIRAHQERGLSFQSVKGFNLDEYVGLSPDHPQSYRHFMQTQLFDHIDIQPGKTKVPAGTGNAEEEASSYEDALQASDGVDIQILGIGENGHIGFNEPGTPFDSLTHVVELTESTRAANARFFDTLEEVPTHAVTMGIETILRAKQLILLISGSHKKVTYEQFLRTQDDPGFPASALKNHPNLLVFVTEDARS